MEIGFLLSFLAGIASILSPCVLPIIPIVVGHSLINRKKWDIISFIIGFYLVFTFIILLTALFTAAINYYLFYFRFVASIVIIIIGLVLIFNKNLFRASNKLQTYKSNLSSLFMGIFTSLAWAPCYGAYLIALIAYNVSTGNFGYTVVNLLLFTAGFSLTLFLIAFFSSKINLKKIVKYSDWIRIFSGAIIVIAGSYLLLNLLGIFNWL
ncbi:MAG: cytochrome c biogenesis CcdA family protein [Methanomicrobiales archaeon]